MKRSRQLNAQREAKRAMQEVSWSVDDDTPWPMPDRHAGDFGEAESRACEQGCNGCEECTDYEDGE